MGERTLRSRDEVARRFHQLLAAFQRPPNAPEVLRHLAARTGLSAYLGCFDADQVTVVEVVEGPGSPHLEDFEAGLAVSAHATALGKALLGSLPRRARMAYLRTNGLRPFTANTCTDPERLESTVARLQPGQVMIEHGEFRDSVACAASLVPLPNPDRPAWAIVISTRDDDVPPAVCTELVLAASDLAGKS
jgi:DNA-binding IclR family transcriptional regulator